MTETNVWEKPRKTGWRRWRWAIILGSVLLLLLLLAALAPTIASMGWARSLALGQINSNLNGKVTVDDWSLGWHSGIDLHGVKVFDSENREVLAFAHLSTDLNITQVVKGDYFTLGKTKVEGLSFSVVKFPDGTINLQKLVKNPSKEEKPFSMPKIVGEFEVDFHGTVTDQRDSKASDGTPGIVERTIIFDRSDINVKIPDINGQIEHDIDLNMRVGSSPGEIEAKGTVKAFEDGKFDLSKFGAEEEVTLKGFELASLSPFLEAGGAIDSIKGLTNGKLKITFASVDELSADGELASTGFALGGTALRGDTYQSPQISLKIPTTTLERSTGRIRVGGAGKGESIALKFAQGTIYLAVDATQDSLANFGANKAPGAEGNINLIVDADMHALAESLPKLMQLSPDVRLDSGVLHQEANIKFTAEKAFINQKVNLSDLVGFDKKKNQKITARPIDLSFDVTSLGGGGVVPDLRNFALVIESGFAKINGSGESIAKLDIKGTIDLAKGQSEIGQFINFGKLGLDGVVDFSLATNGDLTKPDASADVEVTVSSKQLKLIGITAQPLNEPWMKVSAKGKLVRGKEQFLKNLSDAVVVVQTGSEQTPTVDTKIMGDLVMGAGGVSMPKFTIEKLNVDLPAAQSELAPLLGFLKDSGVAFPTGAVAISGSGSYDPAATTLSALKLNLTDVTFDRADEGGKKTTVLGNYTVAIDLAGSLRQVEKGMELRLGRFSYADTSGLLQLSKVGEGELVMMVPAGGGFSAGGRIKLDANLKTINDVLQRLSNKPVQVVLAGGSKKPGQLLSGRLGGTVEFSRAAGQSGVSGDLALTELGVTTFQKDIENEKISLLLRASAMDDFSTINVGQMELRSTFANLIASDGVIQLRKEGKPTGPLDMVQKLRFYLDVPDLPRAKALVDAVMPEPAPTTQPADALPPIEILSGGAKGTFTLTRADNKLVLAVEDFASSKFAFKRGAGKWGPKDISLKLATELTINAEGKTPLEQLGELQITALGGDVGIAKIALQEPIIVKNPGGKEMAAAGALQVDGKLQDIGQLMAALGGDASPGPQWDYSGDYSLSQRITTEGKVVTAAGTIEVRQFVYAGPAAAPAKPNPKTRPAAPRPSFKEGLLKIANEFSIDQAARSVEVKAFSVEMQQGKALSVSIAGQVKNYDKAPVVNLQGKLGYDTDAIMKIVWPQLPQDLRDQLSTLKLSGVATDREFSVTGKLPGPNAKDADALAHIKAQLSLVFDKVEYQGMVGEHLEIPIAFGNDKINLMYLDKQGDERFAAPATLNGGKFDLSGLQLTLPEGNKPMRITSMREKYAIVEHVKVNKEFIDKYLAAMNPFFANSQEARGQVTIGIVRLHALRLDPLVTKPPAGDNGVVKIDFEVSEMNLKSPLMMAVHAFSNIQANADGTVPVAVRGGHAELSGGRVKSEMDMEMGGQIVTVRDVVVTLGDRKIHSGVVMMPKTLLKVQSIPGVTAGFKIEGTLDSVHLVPTADLNLKDGIKDLLNPGGDSKPGIPEKPSLPGIPSIPGKPF